MQHHTNHLIILFAISVLIIILTSLLIAWLLIHKRVLEFQKPQKLSPPSTRECTVFGWEELKAIVEDLGEEQQPSLEGKRDFLFSGVLPDGSNVVVKKLKRLNLQRKEGFYSEMRSIARIRYSGLGVIRGCCYDRGNRFVVYESTANGSLERWLHHMTKEGMSLDWGVRMSIAATLAEGIAFLHEIVKPRFVHGDIRAATVLLDEGFGPRLIGFSRSRFLFWEDLHEQKRIACGSHAHLAPECIDRNELTTKSDVYSFGVLLLQLISGRKPSVFVEATGWHSIFEWVKPLVQAQQYLELLDPVILSSSRLPKPSIIEKLVALAYECTQRVPSVRPRMPNVLHRLRYLAHLQGLK